MGTLSGEDEDQDQSQDARVNDDPNDDTDQSQQVQVEDPSVPRVVEASEGGEDERIATGSDDDEAPQHRGRESAKERRERVKRAKERDKQELDILRQSIAKQDAAMQELQKQLIVSRITELDNRLATESQTATQMDDVFAKAISAKNGEDAAAAARIRDDAKQKAWAIYHEKEKLVQQLQAPKRVAAPYAAQARQFVADKPWYNPGSGDEDSLIVEALDRALMKTMNPEDPRYWETLDKKVRARLPHKFQQEQQEQDEQDEAPQRQSARKGPPTGGSSKTTSTRSSPGEIRLPKEMVDTMKEAGYWDDPKIRARVAKRYIDGLKNNRNG